MSKLRQLMPKLLHNNLTNREKFLEHYVCFTCNSSFVSFCRKQQPNVHRGICSCCNLSYIICSFLFILLQKTVSAVHLNSTTHVCLLAVNLNRQNRLRFVYTHFKSCDQFCDKTSFDFSYIFRAMQSCARSATSGILLKIPGNDLKFHMT